MVRKEGSWWWPSGDLQTRHVPAAHGRERVKAAKQRQPGEEGPGDEKRWRSFLIRDRQRQ